MAELNEMQEITKKLSDNQQLFRLVLKDCCDIIYRSIKIPLANDDCDGLLISLDGLVSEEIINDYIIKPIKQHSYQTSKLMRKKPDMNYYKEIILVNNIASSSKVGDIILGILSGDTILMVEGHNTALIINTREWDSRSVEESNVEKLVRGPKDSFVEDLRSNTAMIRRKIKDPNLKIREVQVGTRSRTRVSVIYIEDIVNHKVLNETIEKLNAIKVDGIFDSGYIEEYLESNKFSMFPQMVVTERPDKVCGNLLEGRIAILVDGSPDAIIFPVSFIQFIQSPEDYYERILYGNVVRIIRMVGFLIATTFPAFYVAITTFHQEILPTNFILDIAKTRVSVPYPPVVEALLMEGTIELLREASNRLPTGIGQTIGIVGAIVIGDAAVRAGLASPVMVIVVAITAIGSYIFPHFSTSYSVRFIRLPMIIMAATFGAFGIVVMWVLIIAHMCKLNSFGNPYMTPYAPFQLNDLKDSIVRFPNLSFKKRPMSANSRNRLRK